MASSQSKNVLWMLSEKVLKLSLGLFVSGLTARYLMPEGFGTLNYYLAFLTILSVVSTLGMNKIIVREIVADETNRIDLIKTVFMMRLVWSISLYCIGVILSILISESTSNSAFGFIIFLALIWNSFEILEIYEQGKKKFRSASRIRIVSFFLSLVLKLLFIYMEVEILWFIVATVFEYAVVAVFFYYRLARENGNSLLRLGCYKKTKAVDLIRESFPEMVAGLSAILFLKVDQLMLYYMSSPLEVGVYTAAARLNEAWLFVPMVLVTVAYPNLVSLKKRSISIYKKGISYLITSLVAMSIFVSLFVNLLSDYVIIFVFGERYQNSVVILNLIIWGSLFTCLGLVTGSWLAIEKKLKFNLYRNIFGLCVNIILNLILIPIYGAVGAAYAMVLGLMSAYFIFNFFSRDLWWVILELLNFPRNILDKEYYHFLRGFVTNRGVHNDN